MLFPALARAQQSQTYELQATPKTVAYGYYWAGATPVLRIKSGDQVTVHTMITNSPGPLIRAGVDSNKVQQNLKDIVAQVTGPARGPGGHILTGPIYVEGADSGDVLEVCFKSIKADIGYAYNSFSTRSGWIPEDFTAGKTRIIPLDTIRNIAHFADGIDIPMHPFFGSIGVAPPAAMGRINSAPPGILTRGISTTRTSSRGRLRCTSRSGRRVRSSRLAMDMPDSGNGEVDITAMET